MNRVRDAFDSVRAEDELKERMLEAVRAREESSARRAPVVPIRHGLALAACLVAALVLAGGWVYLTSTAAISVDVNPSVERGINCFDRVVSARRERGRCCAAGFCERLGGELRRRGGQAPGQRGCLRAAGLGRLSGGRSCRSGGLRSVRAPARGRRGLCIRTREHALLQCASGRGLRGARSGALLRQVPAAV